MESYLIYIVYVAISFMLALLIESFLLPKIVTISRKKCLFDIPNERKKHIEPVSRLGGIVFLPAIVLATIITLFIRIKNHNITDFFRFYNILTDFMMAISGVMILYIIGIKDDLIEVNYRKKFVAQFLAAIFLVLSGTYINNLYGLFGIFEISEWIGIPLTIFLCIFITNSINLIDGIDGLASGICGIALTLYGYLFFINGQWTFAIICFAMLGTLTSFFYFNVFSSKNKIFMGDTGSLTLGFLLSFLGIRLAMNLPEITINPTEGGILTVGSALFVPMFDTIKVMYARLRVHRNMFRPDRRHIHHRLIDIGFSDRATMIMIIAGSLLITLTNLIALKYIDINIVFFTDILVVYVYNRVIAAARDKKREREISLARFPQKGSENSCETLL